MFIRFLALAALLASAAAAPAGGTDEGGLEAESQLLPRACPPLGTNLIANPGFESSTTSISPWVSGDTTRALVKPGLASAQALLLDRSVSYLRQPLSLCAGTYELQYSYKITAFSPSPGLALVVAVGREPTSYTLPAYFAYRYITKTFDDWVTVKDYITFEEPVTGAVFFGSFNLTFTAVIDNVTLRSVSRTAFILKGPLVPLKNADFETGRLGAWKKGESDNIGVRPGATPISGNYSVGTRKGGGSIRQSVQLIPGRAYLAKLDYRVGPFDVACGNATVGFELQRSPGSPLTFYPLHEVRNPAGDKGTFSSFVTATSDSTLFAVAARFKSPDVFVNCKETPVRIFVDNISLQPVVLTE